MSHVSKVVVYERIREVYQFMISGSKQTKDIILFFSEKWTSEGVFGKDDLGDGWGCWPISVFIPEAYFNADIF